MAGGSRAASFILGITASPYAQSTPPWVWIMLILLMIPPFLQERGGENWKAEMGFDIDFNSIEQQARDPLLVFGNVSRNAGSPPLIMI